MAGVFNHAAQGSPQTRYVRHCSRETEVAACLALRRAFLGGCGSLGRPAGGDTPWTRGVYSAWLCRESWEQQHLQGGPSWEADLQSPFLLLTCDLRYLM